MLETLKPRVFNEQPWHQLMMKHMLEIEDYLQKEEAEELAKENQEIIAKCKDELDALRAINEAPDFLKHLS